MVRSKKFLKRLGEDILDCMEKNENDLTEAAVVDIYDKCKAYNRMSEFLCHYEKREREYVAGVKSGEKI